MRLTSGLRAADSQYLIWRTGRYATPDRFGPDSIQFLKARDRCSIGLGMRARPRRELHAGPSRRQDVLACAQSRKPPRRPVPGFPHTVATPENSPEGEDVLQFCGRRPGFQLVSAHSGTVGREKRVRLLSSPPKPCNGEGKPIGDIHRPLHQDKRMLG